MYSILETEAPRCQERIHRRESRQIEINSFQSFFPWQISGAYLQPGAMRYKTLSRICRIDGHRPVTNSL